VESDRRDYLSTKSFPRRGCLVAAFGNDPFCIGFAAVSPLVTLWCGRGSFSLGVQQVGKHLSEDLLLRVGHAFQSITDWHTRHPALD